MKKLLYIIGSLMMLSALIKPMPGYAETPAEDPACDALKDTECMRNSLDRTGQITGTDWGQSFGALDPKEAGKDLYKRVYGKMVFTPLDEAINKTAAQYKIPPERMSLILGGNISVILETKPNMPFEEAERIYRVMIQTYQRNKTESDLVANIRAKTDPAEIFVNGDLDDSGFDLVNDLNNIEIILFKKNDLVSIGGGYSSSGDGGGAGGESATPGAGTPSDGGSTQLGGGPGPQGPGGETTPSGGGETPATPGGGTTLGGINPNICFVGDDLKKALDALKKSKAEAATEQPATGGSGAGGGGGASGEPLDGPDLDINLDDGTQSGAGGEIPAAPAGDYSQNPLCGEIFCLTLEFIEEGVQPAFDEEDNCIACHVEYINDKLQKTTSHSLTPSKAPGNFGETSACKNASGDAFGSVGINVVFQAVPIQTPAKDDLMSLSSTTEEWDKFWKNNAFWNYTEDKRKRLNADYNNKNPGATQSFVTESLIENTTMQVLESGPDNFALSDATQQIGQTYDALVGQQYESSVKDQVGQAAYQEAETQNDLAREMASMNAMFGNMRNIFKGLFVKVQGVNSSLACQKLKNKKECT